MKTLVNMLLSLLLIQLVSSCCIHQWPEKELETPEGTLVLHLHFNPDFYVWHHTFDSDAETVNPTYPDEAVHPQHPGTTEVYDNTQYTGVIRHVVRIFPAGEQIAFAKEIIVENPTEGNYDCDVPVALHPGRYDIVVWSELRERSDDPFFYDHSDFFSININNRYRAGTEFRDAFRGVQSVEVESAENSEATVDMHRPVAKYEFVATGLQTFIEHEISRSQNSRADLSSYRVVFTYTNFMPWSYNAVDDRLVDSRTGVQFESQMKQISNDEVSLGFDYVMINALDVARASQAVSVMVSVFDSEGEQVANSVPITVPLRRDDHTIIRSAFLSVNGEGGVAIDPNYDGDHNMFI